MYYLFVCLYIYIYLVGDYILDYPFHIQIGFIKELCEEIYFEGSSSYLLERFGSRRNGIFLYNFLPKFFENYHFEKVFSSFLKKISEKSKSLTSCDEYLIQLNYEIINKLFKESRDFEINEKNITVIMFLWSIVINEGKNKNEIECLIGSVVKIIDWVEGTEEEKEEERNEKEKELEKENGNNIEKIQEINRKRLIMYIFINEIGGCMRYYSELDKKKIKKDERITNKLLEVVETNLKKERCLIQSGNKKQILEYIIYSYNKDVDVSFSLSLPYCHFPLSHNTIMFLLDCFNNYFMDDDYKNKIKKNIYEVLTEFLNNYVDVINIIEEYNINKEKDEINSLIFNDIIVKRLIKRISFSWESLKYFLCSGFYNVDLSSLGSENNNIMKKIIYIQFKHNNNCIYDDENEMESNFEEMYKIKSKRPFIIDLKERKEFLDNILFFFTYHYYCYQSTVYFFVLNSEEGCNVIDIYSRELSGEIIDIIKGRERNKIKKERRRYEKETLEEMFQKILSSLSDIIEYGYKDKHNV